MSTPLYTVVRDTREKEGHGWWFDRSSVCGGTVARALKTGDYTLDGFEDVFTVDRKGSSNEFVGNLYDDRFLRELVRMRDFEYAAIVLEFELEELARWHEVHPRIKRTPRHWKVPGAILAKFWQVQLAHPWVHFVFAGSSGKAVVSSLFKRQVEQRAKQLRTVA